MEVEKNILTKDGLNELKIELKNLVEVERPQVIDEIKEAREQGDLSENAEFDAAREKQGQIEDRIKEIELILDNSKVASSSASSNKVRIGSEVIVENVLTKERDKYTVVGTLEADPFTNRISNASPLGQAILNRHQGDVVTVAVDLRTKTNKFDIKIVKINNK